MSAAKELLRSAASRAVVYSGACALGRSLFPKNGALIFYGHRVAEDAEGFLQGLPPRRLDAQLAYLTRHFEILRLSDLLRCYEERRPVPRQSAVITFDDGFRDNLVNALPVLRRHGVTATIFLATGCVTEGLLPWSQRLGYLFQHSPARSATVEAGGRPVTLSLETARDRRQSYLAVKPDLIPLARDQREARLARLSAQLGVEAPRDRMLSWDEVKAMQADGIEFGAHTYSHPLLARIPSAEARGEMERSREDLREHLGLERPAFCFPAGSHNPELMALVRTLGFRGVFQPSPAHRVNTLETCDAFGLARVGLPNAPAIELEAELDGPFAFLRRGLARVTRRH